MAIPTGETDPVKYNLSNQYLPMQAKSVAIDSDLWYYKPGQVVELSGDNQVQKWDGTGKPFGVLKVGLNEYDCPNGITASSRVYVIPFKYRTAVLYGTSGEALDVGDEVTFNEAGKAIKVANLAASDVSGTFTATTAITDITGTCALGTLAATVTEGEVPVLGDAAQPTIVLAGVPTVTFTGTPTTTVTGVPTIAMVGGVLPVEPVGIVLVSARGADAGIEILI